MEYSKIKDLLGIYFNGETTLEQEKSLRVYFNSNQVDPRLKPYVVLFDAYNKAGQEVLEGSLILAKKKKNRVFHPWTTRAAALVISGVAVSAFMYSATIKAAQEKEALTAFKESKELMYLMVNQLNKGTKTLSLVDQFQVHKNKYLK